MCGNAAVPTIKQNTKARLLNHPWFKRYLAKDSPVTFKGFSNPTVEKDDPSKVFVAFTMECTFTEQVRN